MTGDVAYDFRELCREQTRRQIVEVESGEMGRLLRASNGQEFVTELLTGMRKTLVSQRCSCGRMNRVPPGPAKCGACQRPL